MRIIEDLWIITEDGETIFYSNKHEPMKSNLLAMLMSAINSIAHKISESTLSSVKFNNNKYNLLIRNGLLFVASSNLELKEKGILQELESISDCFFKKYGNDFIKNWDYNIGSCVDFETDLERVLPKNIQRIVDGFGWDH
jgi:hypothetical protein